LVDELSLSVPDPAFITAATSTLQGAGYIVDYYPPASVTVAFFRDLPQKGYGLVILRAHTGSLGPNLAIFTSEPYTQYKYVLEQLTDQVVPGVTQMTEYLAINPAFVRGQMHGRFGGSLIIMMGCRSLSGPEMAQAFLDRGAKDYVGWDNLVSAGHTDTSTLALLESLTQGKSMPEAVGVVSDRLGRDPEYGAQLGYYDTAARLNGELAGPLTGLAILVAYAAVSLTGITIVILIPKLLGRR
jgi:hypothetical protein